MKNRKRDIINAIQTGSGVHIKPTKKQTGGFLGTLLASIGVPLALEAFKKMVGGGSEGVPRIGKPPLKDGGSAPRMGKYQPPPPFFGTWEQAMVEGKKKSRGKGCSLGKTVHSKGFHCWEQFFEIPTKMCH